MIRMSMSLKGLVAGAIVAAATATPPVWASSPGEDSFYRAVYLQTQSKDPAAASALFDKVIEDRSVPDKIREEARQRKAECREEILAGDMARLAPPGALAYVEVRRPGEHVGRVLRMLGLVRDPSAKAPEGKGTPLGEGLVLPAEVKISPALVSALTRIEGFAVAVSSVGPNGRPEGIAIIHPGETDLVRGLIETGAQFLEPDAAVEGFTTYRLPQQFQLAVTNRLIIVGSSREQTTAAVNRLVGKTNDGLGATPAFAAHEKRRKNALLFATANGPALVKQLAPIMPAQEARIARTLLDLDHLEGISIAAGTADQGLGVELNIAYREGHQSVAFGLIRTAPCSRRSLDYVPSGVNAVVLLGLNPPTDGKLPSSEAAEVPFVAAMDIGREIFANVEELSAFWLPTDVSSPGPKTCLPNAAIVFSVKDPSKSAALWNQSLALAGMFIPQTGDGKFGQATKVQGKEARAYPLPCGAVLVVSAIDDRTLVIGAQSAAAAAITAAASSENIATDASFKPMLSELTPTTSKAAFVHVGRVIQEVARLGQGGVRQEMIMASALANRLTVSVTTDESPTEFSLRAFASGLPDAQQFVRMGNMALRVSGVQPFSLSPRGYAAPNPPPTRFATAIPAEARPTGPQAQTKPRPAENKARSIFEATKARVESPAAVPAVPKAPLAPKNPEVIPAGPASKPPQ